MAVSYDNRPTRARSVVAALLTVLILVPAGYLFFRVWQTNSDTRTNTKLELQGVEYLATLSPLISGLTEAEASALQGAAAAPVSLKAAVARVDAVDQRLGDSLRTHDRWNGLKGRISGLATLAGDPQTILQTHVEIINLALGLFNAVRNNSTLVRDPDNDLSHLQQAIAVDLPNAVVLVNRTGDLAQMLATVTGSQAQRLAQQAVLGPQFGGAALTSNTAVAAMTDDLQSAVDDTNSTTLSGNLVTRVDAFRRGVENLLRGANPGGAPSAASMSTAQVQLQSALKGLSDIILSEMNGLLHKRLDSLDRQRIAAIVAAALVVLLALAALLIRATGRRRRHIGPADPRGGMSATQGGTDPGFSSLNDTPSSSYGAGNPTRRERSGALR